MFKASSLNNGKATRFTYQIPDGTPFKKLKELDEDTVYTVRSLYINTKSKFGHEPVAVTDTAVVNLPGHTLEAVKTMMDDPEAVEAINAGRVGFKKYEFDSKNGHGYGVEWVDTEPEADAPWMAE